MAPLIRFAWKVQREPYATKTKTTIIQLINDQNRKHEIELMDPPVGRREPRKLVEV